MPSRRTVAVGFWSLSLLFLSVSAQAFAGSKEDLTRQFHFGAEMAKQGNWHEAIFRWGRALALDPANARLHNNLAVAYESLGQYDKAEAEYKLALAAPDAPSEVRENHELFLRFYNEYKEDLAAPGSPLGSAQQPSSEKSH